MKREIIKKNSIVSINLHEILSIRDNSISTLTKIELEDQSETSRDSEIEMSSEDDNYSMDPSKRSGSSLQERTISSSDKDDRLLRKSLEKKVLVDDINQDKKSNLAREELINRMKIRE